MTANQAEYSIQLMSRTLRMSRSDFYAYHSRPPSARQVADDALADRIATIHEAAKPVLCQVEVHLLAEPPFRPNAEAVPNQYHPDQSSGPIDRRPVWL